MRKALYIYVATAGIGRMGFGSWIAGEEIDRSDGDDAGTFARLPDALEHAGKRIERQLLVAPWKGNKLEWGTPTATSKLRRSDVHAIELTFDGLDFIAGWLEDEGLRAQVRGATPSKTLRALGKAREALAAHHAWVEQSRSAS